MWKQGKGDLIFLLSVLDKGASQWNERARIHKLKFHLLDHAAFCAVRWTSGGNSGMSKIGDRSSRMDLPPAS